MTRSRIGESCNRENNLFLQVIINDDKENIMAESLKERVQAAMEKVRPSLMADGGDVELVEIDGNVAKVRLQGACAGCPMSTMTLAMGIERVIKQEVPEIERVESVQ